MWFRVAEPVSPATLNTRSLATDAAGAAKNINWQWRQLAIELLFMEGDR